MSTATPATARVPAQRGVLAALLVPLVLSAVATLVVHLDAGGWGDGVSSAPAALAAVVFVLWGVSPFIGQAAASVLVVRALAKGVAAVTLGVVAVIAMTILGLHSYLTSESSTSALILLFVPLYQWFVVVVATGVAVGLDALLSRWAQHRTTAG